MWYIYKHTFPNGKIYIGLSKQTQIDRFRNGLGYELCPIMFHAIQKYGWKNVITTIVEDNISSLELAQERERFWIQYYNSYINAENSNGYNATLGGEGTNLYNWEEILSDWKLGLSCKELTNKYGIHKDTIRHILNAFNISQEERKEHKSEALKRNQRVYDRNVIIQLWNKGLTHAEIMKQIGCSKDVVIRTLNENNISLEERRSRGKEILNKNPKGYNRKSVCQYTLDDEYIQTFSSIKEANIAVGLAENSTNITNVCKGRRKSAGGYHWQYLDD